MPSITESSNSKSRSSLIFEIEESVETAIQLREIAFKISSIVGCLAFLISGIALAAYFCPHLVAYSKVTFYTATVGLPLSFIYLWVHVSGWILACRRCVRAKYEFSEQNDRKTVDAFDSIKSAEIQEKISEWLREQILDARSYFEQLKAEGSSVDPLEILFLPNNHGDANIRAHVSEKTKESQWQVYTSILSILKELSTDEKLSIFSEDLFYDKEDPETIISGKSFVDDVTLLLNLKSMGLINQPDINSINLAKVPLSLCLAKFRAHHVLKFQGFPVEFIPTMCDTPLDFAMRRELNNFLDNEHEWFNTIEHKKLFHEYVSYVRELQAIKSILRNPGKKKLLLFGTAHDFTTFNDELPVLKFKVPDDFSIVKEEKFTGFSRKGISYSDWQEQNPL